MHGNVKDSDESKWAEHVAKLFSDISRAEGKRDYWPLSACWNKRKCQKLFEPKERALVLEVWFWYS